jgi:hypothetical protein
VAGAWRHAVVARLPQTLGIAIVRLFCPTISSNTNTNTLLRGGAASTRTKTATQLGQSISTNQQRFAIKSVTKFTRALKVSLLACSRANIGGFVQHRSGCRNTKIARLATPSCSGQSERVSCGFKFSGTVSPVSKALPHNAARDA